MRRAPEASALGTRPLRAGTRGAFLASRDSVEGNEGSRDGATR